MPRKKRNLEKVETLANTSSLTEPPLLMTDEELLYWYGLLEEALGAKADAPVATEPARTDEGATETRREFDSLIFRIADRLRDAPRAPVPPLVMSYGSNTVACAEVHASEADDEVSASELLKVLRWKLGVKA